MSLKSFIEKIIHDFATVSSGQMLTLSEAEASRRLLKHINEFFFQTDENIGTTNFEGEELHRFSSFHEFWEKNHREILNAKIDPQQSSLVACLLSEAIKKHGYEILRVRYDVGHLTQNEIAQVRFFTANQDFRVPPEDQFALFNKNPSAFEAKRIAQDPEHFLKLMKITKLSQTDKRTSFAKNAAEFLIQHGIDAFDIASAFDYDAVRIRNVLIGTKNMGYGAKKANMFIRDMVALDVWKNLHNYDQVDVASDINTMKLALRTGILKTEIQLLSSFLDIFCYQYTHIDEMSASSWRAVWEEWKRVDPTTAPPSPCEMDSLLYQIGRSYCKDILMKYICDNGHSFYHFGGRLSKCHVCRKHKRNTKAHVVSSQLPCQIAQSALPRGWNYPGLGKDNLFRTFRGVCILDEACCPRDPSFCSLDPPKSISIKGQTGWTESYSWRGRGGGGMMG